ncbi:MAG: BatA domain-containing protein, partial [Verrucomicrobiales bacterium]
MSQFFVTPSLFIAGLIAISAPIIIHLLNRRRFKKIDWAAMDFLLEAQRLNRRRVKLEELILLILRCLALVLIGLLLARPSLNVNLSGVLKAEQTERIIVLDDSLSMGSGVIGETPMDRLSSVLEKEINAIVNNNGQDLITIVRTTEPDRFSPNAEVLNEDSIGNLLNNLKNIKPSDKRGDLISALNHINDSFESKEVNFKKVVYLMTDLRSSDWGGQKNNDSSLGVNELIKDISEKSGGL